MNISLEQSVKLTFGNRNWHTIRELTRKDGKDLCYWCEKSANNEKAYVNIWGTVCVVAACAECKPKNHGILRDDL